jgi:hypothetical protein
MPGIEGKNRSKSGDAKLYGSSPVACGKARLRGISRPSFRLMQNPQGIRFGVIDVTEIDNAVFFENFKYFAH